MSAIATVENFNIIIIIYVDDLDIAPCSLIHFIKDITSFKFFKPYWMCICILLYIKALYFQRTLKLRIFQVIAHLNFILFTSQLLGTLSQAATMLELEPCTVISG